MKKIILTCAILSVMLLGGCGKDEVKKQDGIPTIPAKIAEELTGETREIETYEVHGELEDIIESVCKGADVEQTDNPGLKMLSVEIPASDKDTAKKFVNQVEKIIEKTGLENNTDYSYFYFCAEDDEKDDNEILMYASFTRENDVFEFSKAEAIDKKYEKDLLDAINSSKYLVAK